jgi:glycosyltransferase involved in cell wall biosynthesis
MISIVVPVFNEEANLPILAEEICRAMAGLGKDWEVLFIDDGSRDGSLAVLKRLAGADPRVRWLAFAENRGQSAGFKAGFDAARGEVVVTMDADLQNDPADIPAMIGLYEQGYDMVIGWREKRKDTWAKRIGSKIANRIRNGLTRETVRDTGCSLKVMRTELARRIPMFTGMHRFLPTLMKMEGASVAEVRVNHRPRRHGVSKYGIWDRALSAGCDLLAVRWMQHRYITYRIKERS